VCPSDRDFLVHLDGEAFSRSGRLSVRRAMPPSTESMVSYSPPGRFQIADASQ
jgi:hypothetical protein